MSSNSSSSAKRKYGVDSLLQTLGKALPVGGSIRLRLVKGPNNILTVDPVDAKAPKQAFPLIAKFPESVVPPAFTKEPWKSGRLYQQDVPKALDDSDDDADTRLKKKKRWRQFEAPKRQWILQEKVDFFETMVARREKKTDAAAADDNSHLKMSSRYEGVPEHNPSHYIILEQLNETTFMDTNDDDDATPTLSCRVVPAGNSTILFAQPASRASLSLSQAQAIMEQQKGQPGLTRMPTAANIASATSGLPPGFGGVAAARMNNHLNKNSSKHRLMGKLMHFNAAAGSGAIEEGEDVMSDVAFASRKGASGARKELLSSMADDSVRVGDDGVLGGTNDAIFAAKQRFNAFNANREGNDDNTNATGPAGEQERGADGAAMQDDFYQRDVQAEYDELDYDANEQFDDDDVDVGETEVNFDEADYEAEDDDEDDDDFDDEVEAVSGAEGLASIAGFKRMLAKARGEVTAVSTEAGLAGDGAARTDAATSGGSPKVAAKGDNEMDHITKIMAAADKASQSAKERVSKLAQTIIDPDAAVKVGDKRVITLEAVRREIWLNHGSIPVKRLMKLFNVKKKLDDYAERKEKIFGIIKELCNWKKDPINGDSLVLKQHYSN
ncbi:hypothetical protein MPSEU_000081100 [Mayamaea pseudoterrestris]|nr:hypothetical protein MPSEU_000081100 [Mayamaea pseudoterrestris]